MDVARLRYEIDSSQAKTASTNLDGMTKSADGAERSQRSMANATTRAGRDVVAANDNSAKSVANLGQKTTITQRVSGLFTNSLGKMRLGVIGVAVSIGALIAGALTGLITGLRNGVTEARLFNTAITEVATLSDNASENVGFLSRSSIELSNQFGGTATAQAQAFYQAISAGAGTAQEASLLLVDANKLARAGVTDVATSVDVLTTATNAYGKEVLSTTDASDALFVGVQQGKTTITELSRGLGQVIPIASSLGVSFDELIAGTAALTTQGQSTSLAITGIRGILSTVAAPTSEAAKLARQLGIEFNTTGLASKGLNGFLQDIVQKTGGSKEALAQLFGSVEALNAVLAFSGGAGEKFNTVLDEMAGKAGATDSALNIVSESLSGRYDVAVAQISNSFLQLGQVILPLVVVVVEAFGSAMTSTSNFIIDAVDTMVIRFEFFRDTVSAIFTNIPSAIAVGVVAAMDFMVNSVKAGLQLLVTPVNNIIEGLNKLNEFAGSVSPFSGSLDTIEFDTSGTNFRGVLESLGGQAEEGAQAYLEAIDRRDAALQQIANRRTEFGSSSDDGFINAPEKIKATTEEVVRLGASSEKTATGISKAAKSAERLAKQKANNSQFISDLEREVQVLGLSGQARQDNLIILENEREVRSALQRLGDNATQSEIENVRQLITERQRLNQVNEEQEAILSQQRESFGGFINDFRSGLQQGEGLWQSFGNAALSVLDKITDTLLNDVLDAVFQVGGASGGGGIFGSLFGGGGGGSFSSGITSGFGLFKNGGFTGNGGINEPAGIVHGQEFVVNADATRQFRPILEQINAGSLTLAPPPANTNTRGRGGSGEQMNVHVTVGVSADSNGNLMPFVEDVSRRQASNAVQDYDSNVMPKRAMEAVKKRQRAGQNINAGTR